MSDPPSPHACHVSARVLGTRLEAYISRPSVSSACSLRSVFSLRIVSRAFVPTYRLLDYRSINGYRRSLDYSAARLE